MKKKNVRDIPRFWLRLGDNAEHESFDDLSEMAERLNDIPVRLPYIWRDLGFEADGFTGHNYVSCFVGDGDAQPVGRSSRGTGALSRARQEEIERLVAKKLPGAVLTGKQKVRQDFVDNKVHRLITELCLDFVTEQRLPGWDIEIIGEVRDAIEELVTQKLQLCTRQQFYPYVEE